MTYRNFKEVADKARSMQCMNRGAVAGAEDLHILKAVLEAKKEGIAEPVLTGGAEAIKALLLELGQNPEELTIIDVPGGENPAQRAVELIASGQAEFLIKGRLETKDVLKPVVDRANGLHSDDSPSGGLMSHLAFFEVPGVDRLIVISDGGMVLYPDLQKKKGIIINAVNAMRRVGWDMPKVAALCPVEKVNPKIKETVEADLLVRMNRNGEIAGCIVEGPLSYDVAMDARIAEIKGYVSPNCGKFDLLIAPDITSGNLLGKCLGVSAHAKMAGFVAGARIPIVLASRGSDTEEKFNSIALCALARV